MINLSTKYLGLKLKSPLVASSSPLCKELATLRQLEDMGAGAVVLESLFEEQIMIESNDLDRNLWQSADVSAEAQGYYPDFNTYNLGPEKYLEHISQAKKALGIPVIASLNGVSKGGWIDYAKQMAQAGADALELNIYFVPTDITQSANDIENMYLDLVEAVTASVKIPVAVKIGPFFSSTGNMALKLEKAGAEGLVMFNRFYQPDFDLEALEVVPNLVLSRSNELKLRLHWVAILFGKIKADMAITGGVHTAEDVLKSMAAGAKVAMMTSALLEQGIGYLKTLESGVREWLEVHEYNSIEQMQGSLSQKNVAHPAAFERANYVKVLNSYALGLPVVK
ncbi:MAG: dihydroorotate dehydrogenase-like protein [Candidatus Korobacteraceae bacterium]|jgi:dihydroorotate dehydrogenase (fumarate)